MVSTTWLKVSNTAAIAIIPKVGSQSLRASVPFILNGGLITDAEAQALSTRVAFIRDPFERLLSCFCQFYWLKFFGGNQNIFDDSIFVIGNKTQEPSQSEIDTSWQAYIDMILSNQDDHWIPQNDLLFLNGVFVPNTLHKLEDMQAKWPLYGKGQIGWINSYTHLSPSDYRLSDISAYYADDITLRGQCS